MSIVSLPEIMNPAFQNRYSVAAFNAIDDVTLDGLIRAAEAARSPLIIQVSVKTVKYWGAKVFKDLFTSLAEPVSIPVTLHLDHCPDPELAKECISLGWNSVLFDGSNLAYDENLCLTQDIVMFARQYGAHVEGETVAVAGVEDGVGSESEGQLISVAEAVTFIQETGIYCYAPALGTAHGFYEAAPEIRYGRLQKLVEASNTPMVLHGGSGLSNEVYQRLIALGAAKVNISTALKKCYADGFRSYLDCHPKEYDPLNLIGSVRADVEKMAQQYFELFKSGGKA